MIFGKGETAVFGLNSAHNVSKMGSGNIKRVNFNVTLESLGTIRMAVSGISFAEALKSDPNMGNKVKNAYALIRAIKKAGLPVNLLYKVNGSTKVIYDAGGRGDNEALEPSPVVETKTYEHKVPARTRQQSVLGTTVTAAPDTRSTGSTVTRTIEQRTGQGDFRNRVSMNFGGSCAITGHNVTQCLQAAHISPFASDKNNNTSNGIFMSADLHLLFDNHLISIDPETLKVHFKCKHPLAEVYEGAVLGGHRVKLDMDALRIHWNLFKG